MKIFPIKKIPIITMLVAIFLAIGLILFVGFYAKKDAFSQINIFGIRETIIESQETDTDNDGLRDWEENLYKTDPLNPDTDADGYLDGEEINSGHNPLVKSPGDKQIFYPLPLGDKYNITNKVLNEKIIDSILESYFIQKNEYIDDHSEIDSPETFLATTKQSTIQEMFKRALNDTQSILIEEAEQILTEIPEIFEINITDNDINISDDNSLETIKLYVSQASSILNSDGFFLEDETLKAIMFALEDSDFSLLDSLIKNNDTKIERAKQIVVPSSWKEIHKKGFELTLLIRNIFISVRDIYHDPIKAYIAVEKIEDFPENWNDLMKEAINLANSQEIELPINK